MEFLLGNCCGKHGFDEGDGQVPTFRKLNYFSRRPAIRLQIAYSFEGASKMAELYIGAALARLEESKSSRPFKTF